jgi:hypothetical protein
MYINSLRQFNGFRTKINHSISNDPYHIKVKSHPTSSFNIVKIKLRKYLMNGIYNHVLQEERGQ